MKKLLFFAVSAILAGASYCTFVGEKIVAKVINSDNQIEQQQEQTLVLEQSSAEFNLLASHSSTAHIVRIALTARIVPTVLIARIILAIKNL